MGKKHGNYIGGSTVIRTPFNPHKQRRMKKHMAKLNEQNRQRAREIEALKATQAEPWGLIRKEDLKR